MSVKAQSIAPQPPLRLLWRSSLSLATVVTDGTSLYGITHDGFLTASMATNGTIRWITTSSYLPRRLTLAQNTLYGYQPGVGLIGVTDQGSNFTEQTLYVIESLDETTVVSQPVRLNNRIHFVLNNHLVAVDAAGGGRLFDVALNAEGPHSLFAVDNDLLTVSGAGRPARWRVTNTGYVLVWDTGLTGGTDLSERSALIAGNLVIAPDGSGLAAWDKLTGNAVWHQSAVGNVAMAVDGDTLYAAGNQAGIWAMDLNSGAVKWDRQYLAFVSDTPQVGLALGEKHLWVGALLSDGYEPAALWAMTLDQGSFSWQATGVQLAYGNGLPLVIDGRIYAYGSTDPLTCMGSLNAAPNITLEHIKQTPNPLRGPMAGFNPVEVSFKLGVPAKVSFIAWHERDERNNAIGPISFMPGTHTINYNAQWPRGWTEACQFGRLAVDIEETLTGGKYTQVLLVPVNTLPDIQHHWAKQQIELMLYMKYIGGYPDLTFQPNNLINRGETSTIIARTLNLEKPSPTFQTKFTDIATHWARNYIMALEEKGIIGGFPEADGTYTFRPNLNITRGQEARILVKAYGVTPAPEGWSTRFTDIAGHWAEADVKALESKGYVTGFREADGSYTYRPEQPLTRAELCTMVVRIRKLSR